MSHCIDQSKGFADAMFASEPAWHGLGTVVADCFTSVDCMKQGHLNWSVEKVPLFAQLADKQTEVTDKRAIVRMDTGSVLGIVGDGYTPFQNEECFDFMDTVVSDNLAKYESVGSLKGGKVVWLLARLPKELRAATQDVSYPYCLLTTSHDGSKALRMFPTSVRVVCWNTLTLALGSKGSAEGISVRHHSNLQARVREAKTKLGLIVERFDTYQQEIDALVRRQLVTTEVDNYFRHFLPNAVIGSDGSPLKLTDREVKANAKLYDMLMNNFENVRQTLPGIKGTAWAAYNSVSEFADHQSRTRGGNDTERKDNRLNSVWFGSANDMKQEAYANALALTC